MFCFFLWYVFCFVNLLLNCEILIKIYSFAQKSYVVKKMPIDCQFVSYVFFNLPKVICFTKNLWPVKCSIVPVCVTISLIYCANLFCLCKCCLHYYCKNGFCSSGLVFITLAISVLRVKHYLYKWPELNSYLWAL